MFIAILRFHLSLSVDICPHDANNGVKNCGEVERKWAAGNLCQKLRNCSGNNMTGSCHKRRGGKLDDFLLAAYGATLASQQ